MTDVIAFGASILTGYFVGAVPFGLLIAKSRGVDIRSVGSGNIGATNVFRTIGKPWGLLTFFLDFAKGLIPTLAPSWWLAADFPAMTACMLAGGVAAILGHSFSCFIGFKGGKGVATGAGVIMGLAPLLVGIAFGVWVLLLLAGRMVSLSSVGAAIAIAVGAWWLRPGDNWTIPIAFSLLAGLVLIRHRSNMSRIMKGTEPKVSFSKS